MNEANSDPQANVPKARFETQKLYVKDASLESPNAPQIFTKRWKPEVKVQLDSTSSKVNDTVYEVVLNITVTGTQDEATSFLVEVKQAGVFVIDGLPEDQLARMLGAYCPNLLFPFAREAIASLLGKGGFPPLLLNPVNFEALYAQKRKAQQEARTAEAPATTH